MPTRSRFHGDVIPVVDGLLPYLLTPRCLQYAERHDTPMQRASILKCRNIIRVLRTHQPNLSYNQKTMELILTLLAEKTQSFSFRDEDEMKDWVACMSKRIRVALRHVQQAILKNPRSAWIREMFADAGHDAESGGQEQEGPAARGDGDDAIEVAERISKKRAPGETAASSGILSVAPSYLVGWCTEHKKAWRVNADAKNSPRLYTDVLELVDDGDEQVVMAAWPDGAKHQIEDLDVDEYNEMQMLAARKRKKALYSAPFEGGELRVCRAADRCPIYIIRYGATQICQLRVDTFDDERKSLGVMQDIILQIIAGAVRYDDKEQLYKLRDKLVLERGGAPNVKGHKGNRGADSAGGPKKRPSAAATSPARGSGGSTSDDHREEMSMLDASLGERLTRASVLANKPLPSFL